MNLRTVAALFKRTFQRFFAKNTFEMGAALAYYAVFSLAPLVLLAVAVAGLVFGEEAAQGRLTDEIETAVSPSVAAAIQEMLANARQQGGATASIIGALVLLFGASTVFVQLQRSLNAIWEIEPGGSSGLWAMVRGRLHTFALVMGIGLLLLSSLVINTGVSAMRQYLAPGQAVVAQLLNQVLSFGFLTLLIALIFKVLPDRPVAWRDVWIGSALTALLFLLGNYLLGLYLGYSSAASAYGAAGSLVVILLWVYYASQILLFGAQFTQVYATQRNEVERSSTTGRPAQEHSADDVARRGEGTRTTA